METACQEINIHIEEEPAPVETENLYTTKSESCINEIPEVVVVSQPKSRLQSPYTSSKTKHKSSQKRSHTSTNYSVNVSINEEEKKYHSSKESTIASRRVQSDHGKAVRFQPPKSPQQTKLQHSFLTDVTDVRQMEQGLLQLLDDFHEGKLQAFGKDCTFEKMENVREQQEKLARLHFDLIAQQEAFGSQTDEARQMAKENLGKLIENLQHLSLSIEQLQSSSVQTDV